MTSLRPTWISFGGTAAIVTSTGLILGMEAAASARAQMVSALLIFALADNLTDSLSMHAYQEAEQLEGREALRSTAANFVARLLIALSFVGLVLYVPRSALPALVAIWGLVLLSALTYGLARARGVSPGAEIGKHVVIAAIVLGLSRWLGAWIAGTVG